MAQPSKDQRIVVGQLAGVFGVKGWLKVRSYTDPEENILQYGPWYVRSAIGLKLLEVDQYQSRPQGLVVHFSGIDDRDAAALLGRAVIEVDKSQLPDLSDDDFYWHQLEGLKVLSSWSGESCLGVVDRVLETGANDVLVVKSSPDSMDDRERLVPLVMGQYVTEVDLDAGIIRVDWDPEF